MTKDETYWENWWGNSNRSYAQTRLNTESLELIKTLDVSKGQQILCPLCGKLEDMYYLWLSGYKILGIELFATPIIEFFQEHQLVPTILKQGDYIRYDYNGLTFLCGDFFELSKKYLLDVSLVYDRALVALPYGRQKDYVDVLDKNLPVNTEILLTTIEYNEEPCRIIEPPYSISHRRVRELSGNFKFKRIFRKKVKSKQDFLLRNLKMFYKNIYLMKPLRE